MRATKRSGDCWADCEDGIVGARRSIAERCADCVSQGYKKMSVPKVVRTDWFKALNRKDGKAYVFEFRVLR